MKSSLKKITAGILLVLLTANTYANPLNKLLKFVDQSGGMSNHNGPAIIKDQQGGYMTGGSLQVRGARPKLLQPAHIQLPKFSLDGCTGSGDFRFGGLDTVSTVK